MNDFISEFEINGKKYFFYDLSKIEKIKKMPYSYKIFIENLIRNGEIEEFLGVLNKGKINFNFRVLRILLQDFTGVPLIADLASLRDYLKEKGKDPKKVSPFLQCHLVVDHSLIVDYFGTNYSFKENVRKEYERNIERYKLLKWANENFKNFKVVPPGAGIVHQVNLEYLSKIVLSKKIEGKNFLIPDTLLGTDSHTPMVNGLGVLGWGVGGIEAEAVMLGLPYNMALPKVLGVKLLGRLAPGITPTDLVLTITEIIRNKKYPSWIVEFFGEGLKYLSAPDRATISNMAPEYGVLASLFPVDESTLNYLKETGRSKNLIKIVEAYTKKNFLFYDEKNIPEYDEIIEIDLSKIKTTISGPISPHQRNSISELKEIALNFMNKKIEAEDQLKDGSVVISAITSCTNTSNPNLIIMAGLLAKKAVEKGLKPKKWVKTSFAPGSKVVTEYLKKANLLPYLEALNFHLVGYGCTTCIGNSGNLIDWVQEEIIEKDLSTFAVLSGNRNFEGRINPYVKGSFLVSPPLVIAFALSGTVLIDFESEPIGFDSNGREAYLKDLLPDMEEVNQIKEKFLTKSDFKETYFQIFKGDENWKNLKSIKSDTFPWDKKSTYLKKPPFFDEIKKIENIKNGRILLILGDNVSTDHISPAGAIPAESPAGRYLMEEGVDKNALHSYGARRGNHFVMVRGTFGNFRIKNKMLEKEGPFTIKYPEKKEMFIYTAAMEYKKEEIPLIVIAGKNYGMGSSRDWAAKGTYLLGVRAIIAKSFERIHRQNLIGMGILPLSFGQEESYEDLNFKGDEIISIDIDKIAPLSKLKVLVEKPNGDKITFETIVKIENEYELKIYKNGGIFSLILSKMLNLY